MKAKDIFWSWDFVFALVLCITSAIIFPKKISNEIAHDIYGVGISVLSIVFSVYFAALAIIMSSSDDSFVLFLEEEEDYTTILNAFRFTIFALFVGLFYSLIVYGITSALSGHGCKSQTKWFMVLFIGLFSFGLFAAFNSTKDSITYAKLRSRFLKKSKDMKKQKDCEKT